MIKRILHPGNKRNFKNKEITMKMPPPLLSLSFCLSNKTFIFTDLPVRNFFCFIFLLLNIACLVAVTADKTTQQLLSTYNNYQTICNLQDDM